VCSRNPSPGCRIAPPPPELQVMAKFGVCTLQSYKGAALFEAVGLGPEVMDTCFRGASSRVGGVSLQQLARDSPLVRD
jgi:glutamate synthase domain-containing protein 2